MLPSIPQWTREKKKSQIEDRNPHEWARKINKALRSVISMGSRKAKQQHTLSLSTSPFCFISPFLLSTLPKSSESQSGWNHKEINYKMAKDSNRLRKLLYTWNLYKEIPNRFKNFSKATFKFLQVSSPTYRWIGNSEHRIVWSSRLSSRQKIIENKLPADVVVGSEPETAK